MIGKPSTPPSAPKARGINPPVPRKTVSPSISTTESPPPTPTAQKPAATQFPLSQANNWKQPVNVDKAPRLARRKEQRQQQIESLKRSEREEKERKQRDKEAKQDLYPPVPRRRALEEKSPLRRSTEYRSPPSRYPKNTYATPAVPPREKSPRRSGETEFKYKVRLDQNSDIPTLSNPPPPHPSLHSGIPPQKQPPPPPGSVAAQYFTQPKPRTFPPGLFGAGNSLMGPPPLNPQVPQVPTNPVIPSPDYQVIQRHYRPTFQDAQHNDNGWGGGEVGADSCGAGLNFIWY